MKQIIERVITYTGEMAEQKDGSTTWAAGSLWITDEWHLMPPTSCRLWLNADTITTLATDNAQAIDGGYVWDKTAQITKMLQSLLDQMGPMRIESVHFDHEMVEVIRDKETGEPCDIVTHHGMVRTTCDVRYCYLENAPLAGGKTMQRERELKNWMPLHEVESIVGMTLKDFVSLNADDNSENDNSEVGGVTADV